MSTLNQPIAPVQLPRRQLLRAVAAGTALCATPALARMTPGESAWQESDWVSSHWLPYAPHQVMRIEPSLTRQAAQTQTVRLGPARTNRKGALQPTAADSGIQPPRAYVRVGQAHGVPPWLLYGVALQESQLKFGQRTLPYPWTLCVRGRGLRYGNYAQTLAALKSFVGQRITNVDCGAMQVNWHWHGEKLGSFERALDPYPNLAVGALILRGHYDARRDWRQAIALYHTGSDASAETRTRGSRYARQTLERLSRMGVAVQALLRQGGAHV